MEQKQDAPKNSPKPIVEANLIARNSNGILRLVATSTPLSPAIPELSCSQKQE
jgi:hypothetical protein